MKKSLSLILLSFLLITSFAVLVSAWSLEDTLPKSFDFLNSLFQLGTIWKEAIIGLIILAIMIAALYDILELTSIFDNQYVKLIISIGLGIVFAISGMVNGISIWMISFVAGLGAFAIWIEILVSIAIFVGLSVGNNFIAKWAAKRKGQKEYIKAIGSSSEAGAAIKGLRHIQKEFRRKE